MTNPRLTALREHTRAEHLRLEQHLNLLRADFSLTQYADLLKGFLGYYRPLEQRLLALTAIRDWVPDYDQRVKTPLLVQDLTTLGYDAACLANLPSCPALPNCHDRSRVMGCLYVLEGSTLGGQMLQRHFKRQLALEEHQGLTFFTGYGPDTPTRWKQFGAWLEQGPLDESVLLATARQTFLSLEGWFTTDLKTLP